MLHRNRKDKKLKAIKHMLHVRAYTAFTLPLETMNHASTIPAQLGMISSDSVNMIKVCQHCAEPNHAVLAQLAFIKRSGMEPAWFGTFSPASVNNIEPNPCCSCAVPNTEQMRFSPKNA